MEDLPAFELKIGDVIQVSGWVGHVVSRPTFDAAGTMTLELRSGRFIRTWTLDATATVSVFSDNERRMYFEVYSEPFLKNEPSEVSA